MTEMASINETTEEIELQEISEIQPEHPHPDLDYDLPYRWHLKSVHKRKSMLPPGILKASDDGRHKFLASVKNRNLTTVKENLKENPALTVLITTQGVSALEEAVKSGSIDMIKLFLTKTCVTNKAKIMEHALLYAIKENSYNLVEYLLKEREEYWLPIPKKKDVDKNETEIQIVIDKTSSNKSPTQLAKLTRTWNENKDQIPGYEDAEYASYITPIILAAKLERQEMIKLLLEHNASEIHPLTAPCPFEAGRCEICAERKFFHSKRNLEDSKRLLEIYKALSSPAYIFLSGVEDPILGAFHLSQEMQQMQDQDPSFKSEYQEIAKRCRHFAIELLELCRTTSEVEVLLKNVQGVEYVDSEGGKTEYPRVLVGLHYNQIEFIAHPYTQQVLQKSWFGGLPSWFSESKFHVMWFLYWFLWIPIWPFCSIFYMLKIPWFVCLMKKPINKFVTGTLSRMAFLVQMVVISISYQSNDTDKQKHFHIIEYIFIVWMIGLSTRHVRMIWRHTRMSKSFTCCSCSCFMNRNIWWFDTAVLASFWLWMICQTVGIVQCKFKTELPSRDQWAWSNPILISEAFFALGIILSFLRLTSLLKASSSLGPLQISLKSMIRDIVRFMIIFVIIMTGFVIATTSIYSHYKDHKRTHNGVTRHQSDSYIGLERTYLTYFWDIFGYGKVEAWDIVVNYSNAKYGNKTDEAIPNHKFTEIVAFLIISSYFIIAVVVLLNMLIAMMANSYNAIAANADSEWKFARTRLWMTYYSEVGALPPPFNVALLGTITKAIVHCCAKRVKCCETLNNAYRPKKQGDDVYSKLVENLNKRYWNHRGEQERRHILISRDQLDRVLEDYRVTDTTQQKSNLSYG